MVVFYAVEAKDLKSVAMSFQVILQIISLVLCVFKNCVDASGSSFWYTILQSLILVPYDCYVDQE